MSCGNWEEYIWELRKVDVDVFFMLRKGPNTFKTVAINYSWSMKGSVQSESKRLSRRYLKACFNPGLF